MCDQGSLATAIQKGTFQPAARWSKYLALRALLRTAREVAQGLSYLHLHNIIHGEYVRVPVGMTEWHACHHGHVLLLLLPIFL